MSRGLRQPATVTAEAAGSSPVVPAIFSVTCGNGKRSVVRFVALLVSRIQLNPFPLRALGVSRFGLTCKIG